MKERCAHCDGEHDLSQLEPSFGMPDVVHQMGAHQRALRDVRLKKNFCVVPSAASAPEPGYFVRVLLPIPVADREDCKWGVWVQVTLRSFKSIVDHWDDELLGDLTWPATLANELPGYPVSLGLGGELVMKNTEHIPYFTLDPAEHPLVVDQRDGVPAARALEWLLAIHHPKATS